MEIKTKRKVLSICLIVAILATLVIGASLAYFSDKSEVDNVFTVGKDVKIELKETAEPNSVKGYVGGITRTDITKSDVSGYKYEDCVPGVKYSKKPVLTVKKDCVDCYLFAELEVSNFDKLSDMIENANNNEYKNNPLDMNALNKSFLVGGVLSNENAKNSVVGRWDNNNNRTVVYYIGKYSMPTEDKNITLFEAVKIPEGMSNDSIAKLYTADHSGSIDLNVTGYAIQADNISNVKEAYDTLFATGWQKGSATTATELKDYIE